MTLRVEAMHWVMRLTSGQAVVADVEALQAWRRRSAAHEGAFREVVRLRELLSVAAREYAAEACGSPTQPGIAVGRARDVPACPPTRLSKAVL